MYISIWLKGEDAPRFYRLNPKKKNPIILTSTSGGISGTLPLEHYLVFIIKDTDEEDVLFLRSDQIDSIIPIGKEPLPR